MTYPLPPRSHSATIAAPILPYAIFNPAGSRDTAAVTCDTQLREGHIGALVATIEFWRMLSIL